jgi:hypothetical protein
VAAQFINDTVHTTLDGAEKNAADAVAGLRALRDLPFRRMLSAKGRLVATDTGPSPTSACAAMPD